ncbi:QueT transporter family protein [Metasolibacillus meyeri]|uniref:QueT transporter family protein n=1 Tax=Metasolibacillus meyeri TaxID=1071052 RepID=UPI000D327487|nr:QueT transporter family protein [Metasolibacillus meyeri]
MKVKFLAASAIIAALYIAVTMLVAPISFGQVQFRIAEMFNHLVAFNPRYMIGVTLGVLISNFLLSSIGPLDLIFGVGHTIVTLGIFIFICKFVENIWARLIINTFLFTFTMFIIAYQLNLVLELPFWETWLFVAVGEFAVLAISAPIMYALNKRLDFKNLI